MPEGERGEIGPHIRRRNDADYAEGFSAELWDSDVPVSSTARDEEFKWVLVNRHAFFIGPATRVYYADLVRQAADEGIDTDEVLSGVLFLEESGVEFQPYGGKQSSETEEILKLRIASWVRDRRTG